MNTPSPRISAVVCTHNRADYLAKALNSLTRQSLPAFEFEILVVDNASTDGTARLVESVAAAVPNLRYVREERLGLSWARNAGAAAARAPTWPTSTTTRAPSRFGWSGCCTSLSTAHRPRPASAAEYGSTGTAGRRHGCRRAITRSTPTWTTARRSGPWASASTWSGPTWRSGATRFWTWAVSTRTWAQGVDAALRGRVGRHGENPRSWPADLLCGDGRRLACRAARAAAAPLALVAHVLGRCLAALHRLRDRQAARPLPAPGLSRPAPHGVVSLARLAGAGRAGRQRRLESLLAVVQRAGRLRTHLLLAAGRGTPASS